MKQTNKLTQIIGWLLFVFAIGFFCLQMGYFFIHAKFQAEYIDNRIFYIINILCVICVALAILLLLKTTKRWKQIGAGVVVIFIIVNGVLLVKSNQQIKNITSISPDFKHVLSIKEDTESGEAVYYRSYFDILARPKEKLPYKTDGDYKVKWLANDVAAVTYKAADNSIHQFIGTYGYRGNGISYYYVGAEMHGRYQGDNAEVINNTEGITVTENGKTELFDWDHIQQFGTLAIVLMKDDHAAWTIALDENFEMYSDASIPPSGNIVLYKATMEKNEPVTLRRIADNKSNE
ncbi:hypothetical protein F3157_03920 [Virgibacillus dakarensis]|uniref:Uncharacterized protein n=1 Tax=Lentibacillus populi TaxID=1827502 RepID=A0A9W5TV19_9BACI|nr:MULTISPECIES: hypothetical protein [Bacillaceae]MTW84805.1 hypothetical protein [Virgibacillus dakarensis]GGB31720.1 hypothetical protein GCM10011409_06370 [Lentibacillus populi]